MGGEVTGNQVLAPGPNHSPKDRSLSIKIDPAAPGGFVVTSFANDDPLACKDYVRERLGIRWEPTRRPLVDSITRMADRVRKPVAKAGTPPAEYVYKQADGTNYLRVVRPGFYQSHWNGSAWVTGAPKGPKIPYRLPELLEAEHETVFVVEGEKDADNVAALGLTVTTNPGGAGKFTPELAEYFRDRDVYILPDNDEAGAKHAQQVVETVLNVARSVRIVTLPGLPDKGDVSDWLEAGGMVEKLVDIARHTPEIEKTEAHHLVETSAEFIATFVPPDYAIDGLVQRRFCYSLTAPTGHGKTAVALLISAHKALGLPLGNRDVEPGRVLYLAGENPDDVRMRWIALADKMDFDPETIGVHFVAGVKKLSEIAPRIREEVQRIDGGVSLVVVDTSAAFFEGDEENGNVQAGAHARMMRSLVSLPGGPCVLVMCHPVKNAQQDSLLPRGGGAFIAEVDGNLTCWKTDIHWRLEC
ncbi:AAA family ATPase [Bradyrhizobium sp. Ai1a-2]|uniref:AAA family ATPase n=1 Tax=Bradyrhizobium sp. Ai1a-2 TaxID=196490 RepID=UPI0013639C32|nr:AAA family ATPase [Bradyrhizobium sp. Ai1a-2]